MAIKVIQNQKVIRQIKDDLFGVGPKTEKSNHYLIQVLISDLLYGQKLFSKYRKINEVKLVLDEEENIKKKFEEGSIFYDDESFLNIFCL